MLLITTHAPVLGEASSDIYFIEIRPFNENFQEGEAQQGQPEPANPLREVMTTQKADYPRDPRNILARSLLQLPAEYETTVRKNR